MCELKADIVYFWDDDLMIIFKHRFVFKAGAIEIIMAKNTEDLYQALFTKKCPNQETARKLMGSGESNYTNLRYAFLANFGGKAFSREEALDTFQTTPGLRSFSPGTTIEDILERSVRFGALHKLD